MCTDLDWEKDLSELEEMVALNIRSSVDARQVSWFSSPLPHLSSSPPTPSMLQGIKPCNTPKPGPSTLCAPTIEDVGDTLLILSGKARFGVEDRKASKGTKGARGSRGKGKQRA
jgi:hypothetical protein